ncbi:MAG: hypothetical protein JEY94_08510 [Melioribacteraceae bacterium]|nr:hypothetical protein [Melioribacteraceae bacterium]
MDQKKYYYATPGVLSAIILSSNFLSANIFSFGFESFTVWFVLSLLCFACGWLINKTLGWVIGGRLVFAVIVASALVSLFLVSFFNNYFQLDNLLTENLVLYTLRDITLGVMALFGMTVSEVFVLQNQNTELTCQNKSLEENKNDAERRVALIIDEAKLKADRLVFEAEKKAKSIIDAKNTAEIKIKELIQIERELLKKYEEEDNLE